MSKVMVTGGAGFIGAHLVRRLVKDGYDVLMVDNLSRGLSSRLSDVQNKISFEKIDLRYDFDKLVSISKDVDVVFHLAAINGTENFYNHADLVLDVGVLGILNVLNAVEKNKIQNLIAASSAEVYQTAKIIPTPESTELIIPDPYEPRYSYATSKIITEQLTLAYLRSNRIENALLFRPHNVYGPDMGNKHVIPQFILRSIEILNLKYQKDFDIFGQGTETRAFCYVDDIISGLITLMSKGKSGEIYHIGNSEEVSINDLFDLLNSFHDNKLIANYNTGASGSTLRRCPDISKIERLGYEPKINLNRGLSKTFDWYRNSYSSDSNNRLL